MLGGGIGALGFFAGPVVGGITTAVGATVGGVLGHMASGGEPDNHGPQWTIRNLAADTLVYHNTSAAHATNIIQNGIQPVANAFGGGQLGAGFYTYTVRNSAELFGGNTTLQFRTTADMTGKEVPNDSTWDNFPPFAQYAFAGSDFLWTDEDPSQYKFHGANLELVNVFDVNTNTQYTPDEYLQMLGLS